MTLAEFIAKWNGKKADFDGSYGPQCVDLFRFFNKEVLGILQPRGVAGAKDFWANYDSDPNLNTNFIKIPNTPDFVPNPGDVMIWNGWYGPYGHIAIVTKADINKFTCLSQNDPIGRETHLKEYTYSKVYGVLRPKKLPSNTGSMSEKTYTEAEMTAMREARDKNWNLYQSSLADIEKYKEESSRRKKEYEDTLAEFAQKLGLPSTADKADVVGAMGRLMEVEDQLSQAKKDLSKQEENHQRETKNLMDEITMLKAELQKQQQENDRMLQRLNDLEIKISQQEEVRELTTRFAKIVNGLLSIFRKGK